MKAVSGRAFFLAVMAFGICDCANAQHSVRIEDYGTWYVKSGVATRIPTNEYLSLPKFWRQYVVFSGASRSGFLIYNTEKKTVSNWIEFSGGLFLAIKDRCLFFYSGDEQYQFDIDSLELLSKNHNPVPDSIEWSWDVFGIDKIADRTYRYHGRNYFLDVTYGPKIDLTGKYFYYADGGENDVFILTVNDLEDTK